MDGARLREILGRFGGARIAVIGDFFLDKLLLIERGLDEPSLETGLTAYQVVGKRISPGAAGTVANNLSALSVGEIYAVGFRGEDGEGWELEQGLLSIGVNTTHLLKRAGMFTPTYIKPLFADMGLRESNRLDIRNRSRTPEELERGIIEQLYAVCGKVDAIIALDQVVERNTGVITDGVREALAALGRAQPRLVIFADSRAHTLEFRDIIVKCNHLEAVRAANPGHSGEIDDSTLKHSVVALSKTTGGKVFVTCGARGILTEKNGEVKLVPGIKVEGPVDICGAGDAATAAIVSSLCCGATEDEAALIANLTASITIGQIGTTGTATIEQIIERHLACF